MKPLSLFKKAAVSFIIAILITFWSSSVEYGGNYPDAFGYTGFPFWKVRGGGIAGIVNYDNLALFKNFIFWFLLTFITLFLVTFLLKKLKRG